MRCSLLIGSAFRDGATRKAISPVKFAIRFEFVASVFLFLKYVYVKSVELTSNVLVRSLYRSIHQIILFHRQEAILRLSPLISGNG